MYIVDCPNFSKNIRKDVLTITTESLAAYERISAHETTPLHVASILALALSITSRPRIVIPLGGPSISA